jgi:hypothetical protein
MDFNHFTIVPARMVSLSFGIFRLTLMAFARANEI